MSNLAAQQAEREEFVRPLGAARATLAALDAITAPLVAKMEQNERAARELGIVREDRAREQAIVAEAEPRAEPESRGAFEHCAEFAESESITRDRVEIFHDELTVGLLNDFEQDLKLDGLNPSGIGIRRNARGGIVGMVILLGPAESREGGR